MVRVTDEGSVSATFAVAKGVKQDCVSAPSHFSLIFSAMMMDVYPDERPGIRISCRTSGHPLKRITDSFGDPGEPFQWSTDLKERSKDWSIDLRKQEDGSSQSQKSGLQVASAVVLRPKSPSRTNAGSGHSAHGLAASDNLGQLYLLHPTTPHRHPSSEPPTTTNTTTDEQIPDFQPPIITIIHAPAATATTITPTSTTGVNTPDVLPPITAAPTTNDADSIRIHPHCERTFTPRIGPYVT
nr:unnamed protein product [Spirometra erinaceieuropaei]